MEVEVEWFIDYLTSSMDWIAKVYNISKKILKINYENACMLTIWILQLLKFKILD